MIEILIWAIAAKFLFTALAHSSDTYRPDR